MKHTGTHWRREYLRLLTEGPKPAAEGSAITHEDAAEMKMMAELIDAGYANGKPFPGPSGEVDSVVWGGPTVSGRLFADELADWIEKRTWMYRAKMLVTAAIGAVVGQIADLIQLWR